MDYTKVGDSGDYTDGPSYGQQINDLEKRIDKARQVDEAGYRDETRPTLKAGYHPRVFPRRPRR